MTHKAGPTTETDFLIGRHSTIYNLSVKRKETTGTGPGAEQLSGCPPMALASIPNTGKGEKKDKIAATYLARTTTLFGSPEGRGLLLQGLVRGQRLGESRHPFAELPRTKCPRQPAPLASVPEEPAEVPQQPGPAWSRRPEGPGGRKGLERSQGSRQRPQAAGHVSGPRKTELA